MVQKRSIVFTSEIYFFYFYFFWFFPVVLLRTHRVSSHTDTVAAAAPLTVRLLRTTHFWTDHCCDNTMYLRGWCSWTLAVRCRRPIEIWTAVMEPSKLTVGTSMSLLWWSKSRKTKVSDPLRPPDIGLPLHLKLYDIYWCVRTVISRHSSNSLCRVTENFCKLSWCDHQYFGCFETIFTRCWMCPWIHLLGTMRSLRNTCLDNCFDKPIAFPLFFILLFKTNTHLS